MAHFNPLDKQNLLYLYDLPKEHYTSVKVSEILKEAGVDLERVPQVRRDINKPFYTAIIQISDPEKFKKACQVLRYFEIEGCPCRALPFDNELLGSNSQRLIDHNLFVKKIPSDMKAKQLEEHFAQYGDVKSLKISLNADHSSRGYGFVCFQAPESSKKALDDTANKDSNVGVKYQPKDKRDFRRIYNNIYVKNLPQSYEEENLRELFSAYGRIESCKLCKNEKGVYAFVCFNSEDKEDREYGPKAAQKAVQELNNREIDGQKLYVKEALKKESRAIERTREMLKYKNSKKRCNLYVKNFPPKTTEDELRKRFEEFGEVESLKMFGNDKGENIYAFVCFKTPDQASVAKAGLHNQTLGDKPLYINHYEIKEFREISLEEAKDKANFQQHRAHHSGPNFLNEISSRPDLMSLLQYMFQLLPRKNMGSGHHGNNQRFQRGGRQQYPHQQRNMMQQQQQNFQQNMPAPAQQQQMMPTPAMMPQPMAQMQQQQ